MISEIEQSLRDGMQPHSSSGVRKVYINGVLLEMRGCEIWVRIQISEEAPTNDELVELVDKFKKWQDVYAVSTIVDDWGEEADLEDF